MIYMIVGKAINYIVILVNSFIIWINSLPFSILTGINISLTQVLIFYGIIIFVSYWFLTKKYNFLMLSLCLILVVSITNSYKNILTQKQEALCIYNIPRISSIHFVNQGKSFWIHNKQDTIKEEFIYKADMFWNTKNTQHITTNNFTNNDIYLNKQFVKLNEYLGFIIDENTIMQNTLFKDTIMLDFIMLRGKPTISPNELNDKLQYKNLIVDGSVPPWIVRTWQDKITHNTKIDGAFILK